MKQYALCSETLFKQLHAIVGMWCLLVACECCPGIVEQCSGFEFVNFETSGIETSNIAYILILLLNVQHQSGYSMPTYNLHTVHSIHTIDCIKSTNSKCAVLNMTPVLQLDDGWAVSSHVCQSHVLLCVTPRRSCISIVSIWHVFMVTSCTKSRFLRWTWMFSVHDLGYLCTAILKCPY